MHKLHNPASLPQPASRYSQAVETTGASRWLHVAGQVGAAADGSIATTLEGQHEQAWRNVLAALEAAGMGPQHLVKVTGYVTTAEQVPLFRQVRDRLLGDARPASTLVVVAALAAPAWQVEIEAIAAA